jgi:hypothetical protein
MGMTMTRTDKAEAQRSLAPQADGYTLIQFASPKLIMAARADRGHTRMTPVEYATHRLGRGAVDPSMIEDIRTRKAETKRGQRVLGGRRITGRQAGSKRPQAWARDAVERATTRK